MSVYTGYYTPNNTTWYQRIGEWVRDAMNYNPELKRHEDKVEELKLKITENQNRLLEAELDQHAKALELDAMKVDHKEGLLAHLKFYTLNKKIDTKYIDYVTRLAEAYFESMKIKNPRLKCELMDEVLPIHIKQRLSTMPLLMKDDRTIASANYISELIDGRKVSYPWWNLWQPTYARLGGSGNENADYLVPTQPNFWKYGMIVTGSVAIALGGKWIISRASQNLTDGITNLLAQKAQQLPSTTVITQSLSKDMIEIASKGCTNIYEGMLWIWNSGHVSNILPAFGQQASDESIRMIMTSF
ncbi:hypothetical protein [Hubei tombus-like virus 28]|uniref:hypothetical protein n=1 Tax=Hubei tombus-like virus 28 TaxID=1923275 RepID=UPI00090AD5A3|nr:hypothetical protein [Hubei tombus-like virus 28]APG76403.1 hypothetical protein [Hubei tombus-like virus 28]